MSIVENGDLTVREIATGASKRLTAAPPKEFAYFSSISRDSKSVAYAWFNSDGFYELRSIQIDGTGQKTLFKNPEAGFVQPCAWTPDNKYVLTLFFRKDNVSQIALVPIDGGAPRVLKSLNWVYPKRMDISPDGDWLAYDSFAPGSTSQRTIYMLKLDGSAQKPLINDAGNHLFPLFSIDGKSVYFLSGDDLVEQPLVEGGKRRVVERKLGRALPLGVTTDGKLYYGLRTGVYDVFLALAADVAKTAKRASRLFPNRNMAPMFSADGKKLAYLSRRGNENFGQEARAIVVRELDSEKETELPVKMAHIERVVWRHDGKALLVSGSDGRGRGGIFEFDLATSRTVPLAAEIGGPYRGFDAISTRDGVFYSDGRALRNLDGTVFYEGREIKSIAATSDGVIAVYDKNTVAMPAIGRFIVMDGVTELVSGGTRIHAVRNGVLVQPTTDELTTLPGNARAGVALSPDGKTIALTAGREVSEIWSLSL
jgi:Tol biopolymer transport system component